jgi:hypothetical protein
MTSSSSSMPSSMPSLCSSDDPMIDLEISLGRIEYDNAASIKKEYNNPYHQHQHLARIRNISSSSQYSCDQQQQQQQQHQQQQQQQQHLSPSSNNRQTRTSSRTPFLPDDDAAAAAAIDPAHADTNAAATAANANAAAASSISSSNLLRPYPISETDYEIIERRRSVNMMGQFVSTTASFDMNNDQEEQDQRSMMEVTVGMEEDQEYYADDINVPHNDDFVLSAEEAGSMIDESLDTRTIQDDPGSFWENTPVIVVTTTTNTNQNQNHGLSMSSMNMDTHTTSSSEHNLLSSVPFSVSFSSSNHHHPHDDSFGEEDETADASPIRSSDMEW